MLSVAKAFRSESDAEYERAVQRERDRLACRIERIEDCRIHLVTDLAAKGDAAAIRILREDGRI